MTMRRAQLAGMVSAFAVLAAGPAIRGRLEGVASPADGDAAARRPLKLLK